jgi:hypothetical protein
VAELAESGAGDEAIMSIAGHVSRAMLSRYSELTPEWQSVARVTELANPSSNCRKAPLVEFERHLHSAAGRADRQFHASAALGG